MHLQEEHLQGAEVQQGVLRKIGRLLQKVFPLVGNLTLEAHHHIVLMLMNENWRCMYGHEIESSVLFCENSFPDA